MVMKKNNLLTLNDSLNLSHKKNILFFKKYINDYLSYAYNLLGFNNLDIKKAVGSKLWLYKKKIVYDFTSAIGVLNLGHNDQRIIDAEIKFQKSKQVDLQKFGPNKLVSALAYNLINCFDNDLKKVFFAVSGAEANEAAVKLCMSYNKKKKIFLSAADSYHGKTLGALSLTNTGNLKDGFLLGIPKKNQKTIEFNNLKDFKNKISKYKGKILAVIVEPIQGQNIEVATEKYLKGIIKISKENDILVIFDEVKCGMGRSGYLFYHQKFNLQPDIVTTSKSLGGGKNAISAMITTNKVFKKAYGSLDKSTIHTTTFFGLGEACATAIKTLEIIANKKFLSNVQKKSQFVKKELSRIKTKFPHLIKSIKGEGLFIGIELDVNNFLKKKYGLKKLEVTKKIFMASLIREFLIKENILLHFEKSRPDILVFLPSLLVKEKEIKIFLKALEKILSKKIYMLISSFISGNIKDIKNYL